MSTTIDRPEPKQSAQISPEGLYRWGEIADRIPYSRETWRQRVKAGAAPKPVAVGAHCTAWRGADILKWLANPAGYKAETAGNTHCQDQECPDKLYR